MEPVHQAHKASKPSSADVISSMPDNVITNILDRLMIEDAVGTSILSRSWRSKYTFLSQLVFDEHVFAEGSSFNERDITRLLLDLKGPITKFVLIIPDYKILDVKEMNHWIKFLSNKGVMDFSVINKHQTQIKLPTHLYSCLELKHLKIHNCSFHLAPNFRGFADLLSLDLNRVTFTSGNGGEFITQCPVLHILKISYDSFIGELKLADIAKLANLSTLYLPLIKIEDVTSTCSIISHIGSYFPNLQELYLDLRNYNFIGEAGARKFVRSNFFPSLKTLTLNAINFSNVNMVVWTFLVIFGCPVLQTLNITDIHMSSAPAPISPYSDPGHYYNRMGLLQIRNVVFSSCRGSDVDICLIKCLLACSPLLKQFIVRCDTSLMSDDKLMFAMKLLKLHRAYGAEIVLY